MQRVIEAGRHDRQRTFFGRKRVFQKPISGGAVGFVKTCEQPVQLGMSYRQENTATLIKQRVGIQLLYRVAAAGSGERQVFEGESVAKGIRPAGEGQLIGVSGRNDLLFLIVQ